MRPMLAHRFADHRPSITYPIFLQPKLNGVRCLYNTSTFQSRDEHLWRPSVLAHLEKDLRKLVSPRYLLDGELYLHGLSLQQINGAVSVNRLDPETATGKIEYHVFDIVDKENPDLPFAKRAVLLQELKERTHFKNSNFVRTVTTLEIETEGEAEWWYSEWRKHGYEGSMYRDGKAAYGFSENCGNQENRWKCLLKRKDWLDEIFRVVGTELGTGKYEGLVGALICELPNGGRFSVGTGISDTERETFLDNPPSSVKVRFMIYSDGGIPIQPTVEEVYF